MEAALPAGKRSKGARIFSPDSPSLAQTLKWNSGSAISSQVPSLKIYTVVALDLT